MPKIRIPLMAKKAARRGLMERKINKAGLTKSEASRLGVDSGVKRAGQIMRNKFLYEKDAKRVAAFYDRFKNCRTERCETAIRLWGGRSWGRRLANKF